MNYTSINEENGAEYILKQLKLLGITHLFMIPGKLINAFMRCYPKNINRSDLPIPIVTACETGSAYMTEGYARASENFGVCLVIGGPGATNTLTGIASAYTDNFPILLIVGQIASTFEMKNVLQDSTQTGINLTEIFRPITRSSYDVKANQNLSSFLKNSLKSIKGIERGPAYLGLSKEVLYQTDTRPNITNSVLDSWDSNIYDESKLQSVNFQKFIKDSQKIGIIVGLRGKNTKTTKSLVEFAEKFNIPVATTLSAKGVFPENHPLSLGVYGYSGNPRAIEAFNSNIDGVILLGLDTTQWSTMMWSPDLKGSVGTIQVDENKEYLGKYLDVDIGILSSPDSFLKYVATHYKQELLKSLKVRQHWVNRLLDVEKYQLIDFHGVENDHPVPYIEIIKKYFPVDGIVSVDSGSHRSFFGHYWSSNSPDTYLSATTLGPMGWSIPAGIGASFAQPDKKCMVITGDGCMLMQGMELATARKYKRNIIFVVFNNHSYSASYFNNKNNLDELTSIPDYDWCKFGESLGVKSLCVRTYIELEKSFPSILELNEPFLLEIKCSPIHPTPNKYYSQRIKEFPLL